MSSLRLRSMSVSNPDPNCFRNRVNIISYGCTITRSRHFLELRESSNYSSEELAIRNICQCVSTVVVVLAGRGVLVDCRDCSCLGFTDLAESHIKALEW